MSKITSYLGLLYLFVYVQVKLKGCLLKQHHMVHQNSLNRFKTVSNTARFGDLKPIHLQLMARVKSESSLTTKVKAIDRNYQYKAEKR